MLKHDVCQTLIVAYREDTGPLYEALEREGFDPTVQRAEYTETEMGYSRNSRCLLNHMNAWRKAAACEGLSLIVEADFVPVRGMGLRSLPMPPSLARSSFGYLYAGAPTLFDVKVEKGHIFGRGHASTTVAYVVGPEAAACLLDFANAEIEEYDLSEHFLWECRNRMYLQKRGFTSWLPYRHYGEHGGVANTEHQQAGFNGSHQADKLYGSLSYLPPYAKGRPSLYVTTRIKAYIRGWLRLMAGRYLHLHDIHRAQKNHTVISLLKFAVGRLIPCMHNKTHFTGE